MYKLILILLIQSYWQYCRLIQKSFTDKPTEAITDDDKEPKLYEAPEDPSQAVCNDFVGKKVCCTEFARLQFFIQFVKILAITPCQTSYNNLVRYLCHIHCSPDQDQFVNKIYDKKYIIEGKELIATAAEYKINRNSACEMYKSQRKIPLYQTLESTKNMIGFYKFLGEANVTQKPEDESDKSNLYVQFYDFTDEGGLTTPVLPCNTIYKKDQTTDQFGYPIDPNKICGCDTCQENCKDIDWSKILKEKSIFEGFNKDTWTLLIFLIVLTIFALLFNCKRKRDKDRNRARSVDSYEQIKTDLFKQLIFFIYIIQQQINKLNQIFSLKLSLNSFKNLSKSFSMLFKNSFNYSSTRQVFLLVCSPTFSKLIILLNIFSVLIFNNSFRLFLKNSIQI